MIRLDYLENNVITSCIPTVKRTERKPISAVTMDYKGLCSYGLYGLWHKRGSTVIQFFPGNSD